MEAYRQTISDLGARVSWYLPQHAQLVRMNAEVRAQVEAQRSCQFPRSMTRGQEGRELLVYRHALVED